MIGQLGSKQQISSNQKVISLARQTFLHIILWTMIRIQNDNEGKE
jgi:hypothetical protein